MKYSDTKRSSYLPAAIVCLLLAVVLTFVATDQSVADRLEGFFFVDVEPSTEVVPFPINENGETYGSWDDGPEYKEPDLIAALATNEKEGYIRRSEMEAVDGTHVESPEEIDTYMEEMTRNSVQALYDAFVKRTDEEVTREAVENFYELLHTDPGIYGMAKQAEDAGLPSHFTEEEMWDIYMEAQEAVQVYIPVYESDGVTVIGEFGIGGL